MTNCRQRSRASQSLEILALADALPGLRMLRRSMAYGSFEVKLGNIRTVHTCPVRM